MTAKPRPDERRAFAIHGIDLVPASEGFTVARFRAWAIECEREVRARGAVPIFVGGTGLYLKAMTHGLFEGPQAEEGLRRALEERAAREGDEALHGMLTQVDPEAASRIHPRDRRRTIRALEVHAATGRPISSFQREWSGSAGIERCIVGLAVPREELDWRIAVRVERMFDDGVVEEIRRARESGLSREASRAVGVPEIVSLLDGALSIEACKAAIARRTRQLARRQATWFRSFPEIRWIEAGSARPIGDVAAEAARAFELT